jgi:hypothetical protein
MSHSPSLSDPRRVPFIFYHKHVTPSDETEASPTKNKYSSKQTLLSSFKLFPMKSTLISIIAFISVPVAVSGYAFVSSVRQSSFQTSKNKNLKSLCNHQSITRRSTSSLQMVDQQVLMGAGVAIAGLAAGIGMVAFTENQVCVCVGSDKYTF